MEFFNKKEEVLDVELTEYGKYLLATGQLNPTYYAFFDDDVQYDVSGSGYTENQNGIANRIQYNTPKLKIIANRTGAETRVKQFLSGAADLLISTNSEPANNVSAFQTQQPFENKGKLAVNPLGNSSISTPYPAAWQLSVVSDSEISSSSRNYQMDPSGSVEKIPQINITIDYQTFFASGELSEKSITGHLNSSNVFLALNENYLMIELMENNTDFEKENFDIEVFEVQAAEDPLNDPEVHIQKSFLPDGGPEQFLFPTTENVEYYMNVWVDSEVPTEVIEALNISSRSLNTNLPRLKLNRDLYTTVNEEPCE